MQIFVKLLIAADTITIPDDNRMEDLENKTQKNTSLKIYTRYIYLKNDRLFSVIMFLVMSGFLLDHSSFHMAVNVGKLICVLLVDDEVSLLPVHEPHHILVVLGGVRTV